MGTRYTDGMMEAQPDTNFLPEEDDEFDTLEEPVHQASEHPKRRALLSVLIGLLTLGGLVGALVYSTQQQALPAPSSLPSASPTPTQSPSPTPSPSLSPSPSVSPSPTPKATAKTSPRPTPRLTPSPIPSPSPTPSPSPSPSPVATNNDLVVGQVDIRGQMPDAPSGYDNVPKGASITLPKPNGSAYYTVVVRVKNDGGDMRNIKYIFTRQSLGTLEGYEGLISAGQTVTPASALPQAPGQYAISFIINPDKNPLEKNHDNNTFSFQLTIAE